MIKFCCLKSIFSDNSKLAGETNAYGKAEKAFPILPKCLRSK